MVPALQWSGQLTIDQTITIEGAATALALVAAAIGYLLNLVGAYRRRQQEEQRRGDKLVLLELLKTQPVMGLSSAELLERFQSDEGKVLVERFKAGSQRTMTEDQIELRLRELQTEQIVDPTVSDTYVLRTGFSKSSEQEAIANARKGTYLRKIVTADKIIAVLSATGSQADVWSKRDANRIYARLGTESALDALVQQLDAPEPEVARYAAQEIADLLWHGDPKP